MKILVAPDSFKGSLGARAAAEAMRAGALRACPGAEVDVCPLSDGGEGFLDVIAQARGAALRAGTVTGPEGAPVEARWGWVEGERLAILESAAAVGLSRVKTTGSPAARTTFGVGELLRLALDAGAREILVGLGGSSTTDGGAGMAQALGVGLPGATRPLTGAQLAGLRAVDVSARDPRLAQASILFAHDVDNPLAGPRGAAPVYGPQKGAGEAEVAALDAGLAHLARLAGDPGEQPGDGAAGGLGYGLRVFAGARGAVGIDLVLAAVRFDARVAGCDLVLTGEGRLDAQTARGKAVAGVAARCRARGVPAVAIAGGVDAGAEALYALGLTAFFSLCDGPRTEREARENAAELVAATAENVVRLHAAR